MYMPTARTISFLKLDAGNEEKKGFTSRPDFCVKNSTKINQRKETKRNISAISNTCVDKKRDKSDRWR